MSQSSSKKRQTTIPFPVIQKRQKLVEDSEVLPTQKNGDEDENEPAQPLESPSTVNPPLEKEKEPEIPLNVLDDGRKFCVTGSEANAIFGVDKWKGPKDVFFSKVFDFREPDNENMAHGRKYEPIALKKFEKEFGVPVRRFSVSNFLRHPIYPWLGGSLDGTAIVPSGERVVIEVKCPPKRPIIRGYCPSYYYIQCQLYLELTGYETCLFVQYKPEWYTKVRKNYHPEVFEVLSIPRNRIYMIEKLPILKAFWDQLWLHRKTVGKYMLGDTWRKYPLGMKIKTGISWDVLRAALNTKLPKDRNRVPQRLIQLHWIRRFKTAIAHHMLKDNIPYQKPSDLARIIPCSIKYEKNVQLTNK